MNLFKRSPAPFSHHELLEACGQAGCPVCRVGAHSSRRYLKSVFYEYVNDIETRNRLNKRLGVCREHVQFLLDTKIADTLGASIIYENIAKVVLREWPFPLPVNPREFTRLLNRLTITAGNEGACIVCEQRDEVIDGVLREMSRSLGDEKLQAALKNSDGLCLPHLQQLLEIAPKTNDMSFLMELTQAKLESMRSEMAEVIRKSDYRTSSEEISQEEAMAWKKAMCMISGVSISSTGDKHG